MNRILILLLINSKNGTSIRLTASKHCLIGKLWKSGFKARHECFITFKLQFIYLII